MTDVDLILQAVGGMPLIVLGIAVLFLPRRRADAFFLAGFCLLWGAGVETIALGRATGLGAPHREAFALAYHAANVLAVACLLSFVAWMRVRRAGRGLMTALIAALVVVGLVASIVGGDAGETVAVLVYLGGLSLALIIAYRGYRRAAPGSARQRERLLLAALSLVPAYLLASFLADDGLDGFLFAIVLLPVVAVHAHALLRPPPPERRDAWLSLALLVPLATGALNALPQPTSGAGMAGMWRFATAALLAFAIARSRLFDVELRLRRAAGPAIAGLVALAGLIAGAAMLATGETLAASAFPIAAGAGIALMLVAARRPLGKALFPIDASEARVRERKLEVYAAAVMAAANAGLGADTDEVRSLRRTFEVTPEEHAAIVAIALPQRDARRLVLQRYRILHALGDGGQGSAFLARDERTGVDVAVKLVSRYGAGGAMADALLREASLASSLEHRHIVKVIEANVDGDDAALVMEYAAGGSLRSLLHRKGHALPLDEALRIMDDVLSGLGACHARGIVHGDVKPENVLLDTSTPPRAMLADFGVARDSRSTSATIGASGTLLYMAPEQVLGHGARPESDVYAATVLLYEMLTGRHPLPLAGRDDYHIRQLIIQGPTGDLQLRGEAARYAVAIQAGLETRPEDRPSAAALRAMLVDPPVALARRP